MYTSKITAILIAFFLFSFSMVQGFSTGEFERSFHSKKKDQDSFPAIINSTLNPTDNTLLENTPPLAITSFVSDSIVLCLGNEVEWDIAFIGPEEDQFISITFLFSGSGLIADYTNGSNAEFHASFSATNENIGVNELTIIATDNGEPELSTVVTFVFIVLNEIPPIVEINLSRNCNENWFLLEATPNFDQYDWSCYNSWSNHAISYTSGPINLSVQDNNCHKDTTIIIPEFLPSILELSSLPILCPGDTSSMCVMNAEYWETLTWDVTSQICESSLFESEEDNCQIFSSDCSFYISLEGQGINGCHLDSLIFVEYLAINSPILPSPFILCDSLTEITLTTPTLDEQAQLIITCFSHLYSGGWQGSYITVQIICEEDGTIDEYVITSTGDLPEVYTFPIFPCMSVNILYFNSSTSEYTDEHFVVQFQDIEETFFLQEIDVFQVWSGTAELETQAINFNWSATGPDGWFFSENDNNEDIFIPANYGEFELQLTYNICQYSYPYPLSVIHEPSIWFTTDQDILLCNSDSTICTNYSSYTNPENIQWFLGFQDIQSEDLCFTIGPFGWYTSNFIYTMVQNECGQSSDTVNFVYYPAIYPEIIQFGNTLIAYNCECEFQWFMNGNPIADYNFNTLDVSETGNYSVMITNECEQILTDEISYLNIESNSLDLTKWPITILNQDGQLNLILKDGLDSNSLQIIDILGQNIFFVESLISGVTYSPQIESAGVYFLILKSNNHNKTPQIMRLWKN